MSQGSIQPSDFADQMKALAEQAQRQIEEENNPKKTTAAPMGLLQMLRPLVLGLEALSRATVENTLVLSRIEAASSSHDVLPRIVSELQEKFESKNVINQQLFDALHQELKGYKDGFILEVLQKPLVRDLITLYDDLSEIHKQMGEIAGGVTSDKEATEKLVSCGNNVTNTGTNLHHVMQFLLEIMARMEMQIMEPSTGKLNKQTQRAISVELADLEVEDGDVCRSLKPGFMWRGRIVRPEEVVIKKWKEGFLVALSNEPNDANQVKSGTTDAI